MSTASRAAGIPIEPTHSVRTRARSRSGRTLSRVLLFLLIFVLGAFVARLPATLAQMGVGGGALDPIEDVYALISNLQVDKPSDEKLQRGAIEGMLEALNDNYAEFIPAEDKQDFDKEMTGRFVGIGCQVEIRDGWLTVVTPLEDSPALKAGVLANDRISAIEGESTFKKTVDQSIKRLTGEPGTPVTITVQRDGAEMPFTIIRAEITSKSVRGVRRLNDGTGHWDFMLDPAAKIAYVRLSQFTPTSAEELFDAIRDTAAASGTIRGIILDLRNNPGGFMDAAIEIADLFITDGVIMSIKGRVGPDVVFRARNRGTLPDVPVAVLVNRISASASEIVSGALQDHNRGIVIGERSFGKGLVQTVHAVPHLPGAEIKFTTQRYYLPSGRSIHRSDDSTQWGVDPSPGFYVPMTDKEQIDAILWRRDRDILRASGIPGEDAEHWDDPKWVDEAAKDRVLAAAVRSMNTRLTGGSWVPIGDAKEEHGKLAANELRLLERTRERLNREFLRLDKRIETLETAAQTGAEPAQPKDLWPDSVDLSDGHIQVFDKDGKPVARLKITGRDVERWLSVADVEPEPDSTAPPPAPPTETPASTR